MRLSLKCSSQSLFAVITTALCLTGYDYGSMATVSDLIADATALLAENGVDTPRLDAQLLLAHVLGCRREDLVRDIDRPVDVANIERFRAAAVRRASREPLPYITGTAHFCGREFVVTPHVLIPRPETELAVSAVLRLLTAVQSPRVVDVGTGSGCIAVTLAAERPDMHVWASDASQQAIDVARTNAQRIGVDDLVLFQVGDLLTPVLSVGPIDVIVSNPPYISVDEIRGLQPEVRDFEPRLALAGADGATGTDGAGIYRRLIPEALQILNPGGWIVCEIGLGQEEIVQSICADAGYTNVNVADDYASIPRVLTARRAP